MKDMPGSRISHGCTLHGKGRVPNARTPHLIFASTGFALMIRGSVLRLCLDNGHNSSITTVIEIIVLINKKQKTY